jgi:hypothetical protein
VRAAAAELLAMREPDSPGVLVEPMVAPGVEVIVGVRRDPSFGPCVIVGLGGILAEALDDVAIRLAPVPADEATIMVSELRGRTLLDGFRYQPRADVGVLADVITRLGDYALGRPEVVEIDLNPVIVGAAGATIVDALIVTRST